MSAAAAGEAPFGGGVEKGPLQQQPNPDAMLYMHNGGAFRNAPVPAAYPRPASGNAASPAAASAPSPGATGSGEPFKRKRGRPRKYAPDSPVPLAVIPGPQTAAAAGGGSSGPDGIGAAPTLPPGFSLTMEAGGGACHPAPPQAAAPDASHAKKMGRPPGSGAKKLQPQRAPQGVSTGWKPHIFTVQAGEDVASRVMSFSCNGWAVCILSANGAVSNVTLRQGDSSGGTVTYEGRFEILSLAGSYLLSDSSGLSSRTGGLSVSLASSDGHVLGGAVAGPLTAASPVQVVIGSFLSDGKKEHDLSFAPGRLAYSAFAPSSGPSSGGHGSPPNTAGVGSFNTSNQPGFPNFPSWK
ncbi:hypothetical protein QOZ80_6AG0519350 [Eleusine coracana subsp. coracana]|nr:hypothetical protein QOZ80_6AG0519350 [Eleusine coracana subsp. coracana]